jgi:hypothetical protein
MSARLPRRTFATPFVVTTTLAACSSPQKPPEHTRNPPPPDVKPDPGSGGGDPSGGEPTTPTTGTPSEFEMHWTVMKIKGNPDCQAFMKVECPKPEPGKPVATCNPPPAMKYTCPAGFKDGDTLNIVLRKGTSECYVDIPPIKCPPNASCNPPRPAKVDCPSH